MSEDVGLRLWLVVDPETGGPPLWGPSLDEKRARQFAEATDGMVVSVPAMVEWRPAPPSETGASSG